MKSRLNNENTGRNPLPGNKKTEVAIGAGLFGIPGGPLSEGTGKEVIVLEAN